MPKVAFTCRTSLSKKSRDSKSPYYDNPTSDCKMVKFGQRDPENVVARSGSVDIEDVYILQELIRSPSAANGDLKITSQFGKSTSPTMVLLGNYPQVGIKCATVKSFSVQLRIPLCPLKGFNEADYTELSCQWSSLRIWVTDCKRMRRDGPHNFVRDGSGNSVVVNGHYYSKLLSQSTTPFPFTHTDYELLGPLDPLR